MIGLGWRPANFGDCIKWEVLKNRPFVTCVDCASGHGSKHPFQVAVANPTIPSCKESPPLGCMEKTNFITTCGGPPRT